MHSAQRFLVALIFTVGALSLLILGNMVNPQTSIIPQSAPVAGQAPNTTPPSSGPFAASTVTTTAIVTSTVGNSLVIPTKLGLTLSTASPRQGQTFTLTLSLFGINQGQNASLPNQQISVSATWGSTVTCVTQNDGACHLDIKAPTSSGSYGITAKYSGNIFFASSTATTTLKVQ